METNDAFKNPNFYVEGFTKEIMEKYNLNELGAKKVATLLYYEIILDEMQRIVNDTRSTFGVN